MKHLNIILAIISAAIITSTVSICAFAEDVLNLGTAVGNYSFEALRLTYRGALTSFSVDLPADRCADMIPADGTPIEIGDGTTGYELFNGVSESEYVSGAFHEGGNGYDGEIAAWNSVDGAVLYDGTDADGQPFCMVRMDMLSAYLAEYPLEDGAWLNIMVSFPEDKMESMRDDVYNMFGTFSRSTDNDINGGEAVGDTESTVPSNDKTSPKTGIEMLPLAVPLFAAAVIAVARKKK